MKEFMTKDRHPRLVHFAFFLFLLVIVAFGLTHIGNQSLPQIKAQSSGLTHYWNMDSNTASGGPVYITDSVGGVGGAGDLNGFVTLEPNGGRVNGAAKFSGGPGGAILLWPTDPDFKTITPPWSFSAWIKIIARTNGGPSWPDAAIFASQDMVSLCGFQIRIENATPTYKLIFDAMDCRDGQVVPSIQKIYFFDYSSTAW
jgi:hypothetical protein